MNNVNLKNLIVKNHDFDHDLKCQNAWIGTPTLAFHLHTPKWSPLDFESIRSNIEEVFLYTLVSTTWSTVPGTVHFEDDPC